jgi:amino acid adenylation domain-containing protein
MDIVSLGDRFLEIAGRYPDEPALITGRGPVPFADLEGRVRGLADALSRPGRAGEPIGLLASGEDLALGALGALVAGRAFLLLDPADPPARTAEILGGSGVSQVLVSGVTERRVPSEFETVRIDAPGPGGAPSARGQNALAFVLFTSGSEGRPRGVRYSHEMVLTRIVEGDRFHLGPGDRVSAYGAGGMNLFRALLRGAALAPVDPGLLPPRDVPAWLARHEISHFHCVPTVLRHILRELPGPVELPRLRVVSATGEPLYRPDVERFRALLPAGCRLVHGLGTTEAMTFCQLEIGPDAPLEHAVLPAGRPVEGVEVEIVDETGRPVGPGDVGELRVSSAWLSPGYWRDDAGTRDRFEPCPEDGARRRYRTGDLGCWLPDGSLLHLGRRDRQLKVGGVRVEPSEIEAALLTAPGIAEAAVAASPLPRGGTRIVAHVVGAGGSSPDPAALRRHLAARLPASHVPSRYVPWTELPRLPRGKVDRARLSSTVAPGAHEPGISEQFEVAAASAPDRAAIRSGDETWTFAELRDATCRLAAALAIRGVRAGDRIGVHLGRGPDVAATFLATLRIGAVAVPLPPEYPSARLEAMAAAAGLALVVTTSPLPSAIGGLPALHPRAPWTAAPPPDPCPHDPGAPAFLLFTSGSTGAPRGVLLSLGQVLHRLRWEWEEIPFLPDDCVAQRASLGFVDGIWEWLGGLLQGVPLVVLPDRVLRDPEALVHALELQRITRLLLVPSQLRRIFRLPPERLAGLAALRLVVASGEVLPEELAVTASRALPAARLWNVYGATEAWDCLALEATGWTGRGGAVPAGHPLPGVRLEILDPAGAPVAAGAWGELYLRGPALALGYLDRDQERRFVDRPAGRSFRSGDRARRLPDGSIEIGGRLDHVLIHHGLRIDPAEVEGVLRGCPGVLDVVVGLRDEALMAWVVPDPSGPAPTRPALLEGAAVRLPPTHLPSSILVVPELPRTASGKLDRTHLDPRVSPAEGGAPRLGELAETIAQLMARALGRSGVRPDEDFFALGGDSLAAAEVLATLEVLAARPLGLESLVLAPSPRRLAAVIGEGLSPPSDGVLAANPSGRRVPLFLLCGAFGHALRAVLVARELGPDHPVLGLQPPEMDWASAGCESLEEMAAHYAGVIRRHQTSGPVHLLGTSFGGVVAFEIARQLEGAGREVGVLALGDSASPQPRRESLDALEAFADDRLARSPATVDRQALSVARAHVRAWRGYRPRGAFAGEALYLRCEEGPHARSGWVEENWSPHLAGSLRIVPLPGQHGRFHVRPQLTALVAALRPRLPRYFGSTSTPVAHSSTSTPKKSPRRLAMPMLSPNQTR